MCSRFPPLSVAPPPPPLAWQSPTVAEISSTPTQRSGFRRIGDPIPVEVNRRESSKPKSKRRGNIKRNMYPHEVCEVILATMPERLIPGIIGHFLVETPQHVST